jgi:hypothetical protein
MNKELKDFSDAELGLILGQEYQKLAQSQGNIAAITQELAKRNKPKEKQDEQATV